MYVSVCVWGGKAIWTLIEFHWQLIPGRGSMLFRAGLKSCVKDGIWHVQCYKKTPKSVFGRLPLELFPTKCLVTSSLSCLSFYFEVQWEGSTETSSLEDIIQHTLLDLLETDTDRYRSNKLSYLLFLRYVSHTKGSVCRETTWLKCWKFKASTTNLSTSTHHISGNFTSFFSAPSLKPSCSALT